MQDRLPTYPGRVVLEPVEGATNTYDMTLADVPTQEGTPLNKANLLSDSTATLLGLNAGATPNDALVALAGRIVLGTADLTAGADSPYPNGTLYFVYKPGV